jgi:carbamoyltransferase
MRDIVISVNLPLLNNGDLTANGNCSIAIDGELVCAVAEERISRVKYDGHVDQTLRYFVQQYKILQQEISKVIVTSF